MLSLQSSKSCWRGNRAPQPAFQIRLGLDKLIMDGRQERPTIAIFGLGYVGCVTAACFAELGFRVIGTDVDSRKVCAIQDGRAPFYEAGLGSLIRSNMEQGRLSATGSTAGALAQADFAFLCVGTPSASNGNLSVHQLRRAAVDIGDHI